jgi:hypothetical protein
MDDTTIVNSRMTAGDAVYLGGLGLILLATMAGAAALLSLFA